MLKKHQRINRILYSERGLVYYLVRLSEIYAGAPREYLQKFLSGVVFSDENTKAGLTEAVNQATNLTIALEPSFGQYGDPDLILIFSNWAPNTSPKKWGYTCIFIEAKKVSLNDALNQPNTSNIIQQLLNKMKLSRSQWVPNGKTVKIRYEGENPIHLKKDAALAIIKEFTSKRSKDRPLADTAGFYFIALTKDGDVPTQGKVQGTAKFLKLSGNDAKLLSEHHIGGLSYKQITKNFGKMKDPEYKELGKYL